MKRQLAGWMIAGIVVSGAGMAFADDVLPEDPDVVQEQPADDGTTTTTVADEADLDDLSMVQEVTTPTAGDEGEEDQDVEGTGGEVPPREEAPGNSWAARTHDCDEDPAYGNHGAWVRANAHWRKSGAPLEEAPTCAALEEATAGDEGAAVAGTEEGDVDGEDVDADTETEDTAEVTADEPTERTKPSKAKATGKGGGKGGRKK